MRYFLLVLLALVAIALSSPIHGIWQNLPHQENKRSFYGAYQYIPGFGEEARDKKNYYMLFPREGEQQF